MKKIQITAGVGIFLTHTVQCTAEMSCIDVNNDDCSWTLGTTLQRELYLRRAGPARRMYGAWPPLLTDCDNCMPGDWPSHTGRTLTQQGL